MELDKILPLLLITAWLLPLVSFTAIVLFGRRMGKAGRGAGFVATGAIVTGFVLSLTALIAWLIKDPATAGGQGFAVSDSLYSLGDFGELTISIGYYIDALTIGMFMMVTLIASCIHVYSFGYMHEEEKEFTDPLVTLSDGSKLRRPGRFYRFYQYLSLFCFSMLGLVIAGNVAMVFVFWELVGICSYFLIGFYIERKSASNAANKAFIVNRVGDFGMIIGLMALWAGLGTFNFGDSKDDQGNVTAGIFSTVRPEMAEHTEEAAGDEHAKETGHAEEAGHASHAPIVPDGMVLADAAEEIAVKAQNETSYQPSDEEIEGWRQEGYGYWLLVIAGLGIFCGCVGKSAQFPLHVWLPDAMEGPTPVSALIHAATMVAAGVYLVGRFYPVFTPEVLLVIAYTGCITLFIAATIAITATDIKRVLAYSTVSQLGYMMLALGVGGWLAGLFHLITHAFFKALLFLCSGSVIHACGTNEMPQMGGLRKKMPWTAYTMLAGCLAIAGAGIPFVIGLSGYYSKDAIIAQAMAFRADNPIHGWLCYVALAGAAITSFYMFRLWYMTFAGEPRDKHVYEHAHESPRSMVAPLVILATFAVIVGWSMPFTDSWLEKPAVGVWLEQARLPGTTGVVESGAAGSGAWATNLTIPDEHATHDNKEIHTAATLGAFATALLGFVLATAFYGIRSLDPGDVRKQFASIHRFLLGKWWFDELYGFLFIRPALKVAGWVAAIDRRGIDWFTDGLARWTRALSRLDDLIDRWFVDGLINRIARHTHAVGLWLRRVQTGNLRQYVMLIAVGTVVLFIVIMFVLIGLQWDPALAG